MFPIGFICYQMFCTTRFTPFLGSESPTNVVYFDARLRSERSLAELDAAVLRLFPTHRATNEVEISFAVSAGILGFGDLHALPYAACFWAVLRRLGTDCSVDINVLAKQYDVKAKIIRLYRKLDAKDLSSYHAADDLDKAAFSLDKLPRK